MKTNITSLEGNSKKSMSDILLSAATLSLLVAFVIFEQSTSGKYILLGILAVFLIVLIIKYNFRIQVVFDRFHLYTALFAVFCIFSMLWAKDSHLTYNRMTTVIEIILFMWILYLYFSKQISVSNIIIIICISGYILAIYSIMKYGLSNLRIIVEAGERMTNSFSNVNTIGIISSISIVITFSRILNKRFSILMVCSLPCFLMVIASGSRKAFICLVVGIIALIIIQILKNSNNPIKSIIILIAVVAIIFFVGRYIVELPVLKSVINPMERMFNFFSGNGATDESVRRRMDFISLGWEQFWETPLLGIGIGNSPFIIGRDTYLHNNFIELLACGGVVGFLIYYLPYIYLARNMIKYRKYNDDDNILCFVIFLIVLILDFGQVSYFSKETYYYLMLFFLNIRVLKHRANNLVESHINA